MSAPKKIKVAEKDADNRLDIFLSQKLKISRSRAQKMIEQNLVLVNNKLPKKAGDRVREGDVVDYRLQTKTSAIRLQTSAQRATAEVRSQTSEVRIVAETPDYIIVNKPTVMLTHPTMANEKNTLVNFILKKYPEIKKVGETSPSPLLEKRGGRSPRFLRRGLGGGQRPGIVHRLDKEASGLLVVARTQKMFNHLKEQFKKRSVEKEYWALVHGKVAKDWGEINFPLARSGRSDKMAAIPGSELERGKEAKTEFTVEKKFVNFTLLRVKIHTGRMHQIRVHMLAYNHPLAGDPLYFQKKQKRTWDEKLGRLFLHSTKLSFTDLEGNKKTFESPLPKELMEFLKLLK